LNAKENIASRNFTVEGDEEMMEEVVAQDDAGASALLNALKLTEMNTSTTIK